MAAGTPTPEGHYVKRVVLPSGKTIEVVYADSDAAPDEADSILAPGHRWRAI